MSDSEYIPGDETDRPSNLTLLPTEALRRVLSHGVRRISLDRLQPQVFGIETEWMGASSRNAVVDRTEMRIPATLALSAAVDLSFSSPDSLATRARADDQGASYAQHVAERIRASGDPESISDLLATQSPHTEITRTSPQAAVEQVVTPRPSPDASE